MPSINQILGLLVVVALLAMAAHEVWVHRHPATQALPPSPRRLRRRLTGVAILLAVVGLLTWAGHTGSPAVKLALYGTALLLVVLIVGLALCDVRETTREIVRDQLHTDPETVERLMANPHVRDLVQRLDRRGRGDPSSG